ncbi:Protein BZZ1 [Coemansia spiralis]|nr:Protein BZZ1 [Coemansia spiralis]
MLRMQEDAGLALDGKSQDILRNICIQAQTAMQARRAQPSDAACRDPLAVLAAKRDATLVELELVQHQALRTAIEQQHRPINPGMPHELRTHTVAIAKMCDYCAESIGRLNRKAAHCAQCDYACRACYQIKVKTTCPGPDPDVRSSFLALFGTKCTGRQKSERHKRTRSAASGDMQVLRDSSQPQSRSGTVARSQDHGSITPAASHLTMALLVPAMALPATQPPGPYGATAATDGATVPVLYDFKGTAQPC